MCNSRMKRLIFRRRYLRARKFVPQDALGQFKDTEDWRKKNEIDKLYDTIDIADYDETRALVRIRCAASPYCADLRSIPNGQADGTSAGFQYTSLRSHLLMRSA